ncbi:9441_t:CDS:2 [Ambispora leptoticha]|uniref:9441_t:CDS:1 n=1 Tax=Ambispora leptoticha TaxID=144679 RepID=A0A9N9AQZ0_9GLOM|nr:9441_t:CDS:2 [Ambispora leptoticha]
MEIDRILYDIDVVAVWKPDDEIAADQENSANSQLSLFNNTEGGDPSYSQLPKRVFKQFTHRLVRSLEGLTISTTVPPALLQALPKVMSEWCMQLSPNGEYLAVLQEHKIEFRSNKKGFETVHSIYKYTVKRDTFPKWRRVAWSLDSKIVAASRSDGTIDIVDTEGNLVCTILPTSKTSSLPRPLNISSYGNGSEEQSGSSFFLEPVAFLAFIDPKRGQKKSVFKGYIYQYELIVVTYDGILRSYLLNTSDPAAKIDSSLRRSRTRLSYLREGAEDPGLFVYYHKFSFKKWLSTVVCGVVDSNCKFMCLGGKPNSPIVEEGGDVKYSSVACWLLLPDRPYYRKLDLEGTNEKPIDNLAQLNEEGSIDDTGYFSRIKNIFSTWRKVNKKFTHEIVQRMILSPDQTSLLTLDFSGTLNLWDISINSGIELQKSWNQDELNYFARDKEFLGLSFEQFTDKIDDFEEEGGSVAGINGLDNGKVVSIGWWSNDAIIIGYQHGSLIIASYPEMNNILGESPEVFKSCREITSQRDNRFLVIEHENKTIRARVHGDNLISYSRAQEEGDMDEEFADEKSPLRKLLSTIGNSMHYVTDTFLWHFENDDSSLRGKFVTISKRTLRLNRISKILPEDLLKRKIRALEYDDALVIAETYNLNTDPIYQARWRDAEISETAIHEYLDKINDRKWVLESCLERIPDFREPAEMLLNYALKMSDILETMLDSSMSSLSISTKYNPKVLAKTLREKPLDSDPWVEEMLKAMNFSEHYLNICRYRYYALKYLDRLRTFNDIMKIKRNENSKSKEIAIEEDTALNFADYALTFADDYGLFRDDSIAAQAMDFATDEFFGGLQILFTRHGPETLPYRFDILEQIPETSDPDAYENLLPKVKNSYNEEDNSLECLWDEKPWREPDWVENPVLKSLILRQDELEEWDFEEIGLKKVPYPASSSHITNWYYNRAHKIDRMSGQVDKALKFVRHGIHKNVRNLETLEEDLHMLAKLVYDCYPASDPISISMTLLEWESLSEAEIVQTFLRQTDETRIVNDIKQFVIPFLQLLPSRRARETHGDIEKNNNLKTQILDLLYDYILTLSENRLDLCCLIFEASKPIFDTADRIITSDTDLVRIALSCLYGNESTDQWETMTRIFECLPIFDVDASDDSNIKLDIELSQKMTPIYFYDTFKTKNEKELQRIIDFLEIHLNASEILSRYDNPVPLQWFLQSADDYKLQKQLSIKLVRKASGGPETGGEKFESEDEWALLLEDMLKLQDNGNGVFGRLSVNEIYRDFISGLLNCGKFLLAREILFPIDQPNPLDISTAEKLVIDSSREFFDNATSGNMNYGYMKKAYECLQILPKSEPIKLELELIEATHILTERKIYYQPGIPIHPLQIRLAPNRLDLIARLLSTHETAYHEPESILELARKLGYRNDKVAEVKVLAMLSDAALRDTEYAVAYERCMDVVKVTKNIIAANIAKSSSTTITTESEEKSELYEAKDVSWRVCYEVGKQEGYADIEKRMTLVGFALALCPVKQAINILNLWRKLEVEYKSLLASKAAALLRDSTTDDEKSHLNIGESVILGTPIIKIDKLKSFVSGWF